MTTTTAAARHPLRSKLAYAAGDIYGGGSFMIFSLLFMNYLVLVEGLPIVATTIVIFVGRLWDAVTDPLVGRLSDRTRTRFGRRRPFFLLGIVPVFASFVMLFHSFGITSTTALVVYYVFAYMFFGTAFTIVMVPYNAILSDITSDYDERTSFTTYRMIFSGGASLLAAVVPSILIRAVGAPTIGPGQRPGYLLAALVFASVFAACWIVVFAGTKERADVPPARRVSLTDWLSVFRNKAFRNFLGIFLAFQVTVDLVLAMFIFYIDIVVLQYHNYELVVGTLLVTMIAAMPLVGRLAQRRGKAFPLLVALPVWIAATFAFTVFDASVPVWALMGVAVLIGAGAAAGNLSTWSMLTDVYDVDELLTGQRREGIYSGVTTFLRKAASGVAVLLMGFGFQAMGFDQDEYAVLKASAADFDPATFAEQSLVAGIRTMFVVVPVVLLAICLAFAVRSKLDKRRFDAVLAGVAAFAGDGDARSLSAQEVDDVLVVTGARDVDELWGKS